MSIDIAKTYNLATIDINPIKLVDVIIKNGIQLKASDVHLEPGEQEAGLRYRILGELHPSQLRIKMSVYVEIIARIKILAQMDASVTRVPQDGRFNIFWHDVRVSSLPSTKGEKVVLRLLNTAEHIPDLKDLGLQPEQLDHYQWIISQGAGLVLVTGPTGSGKTTTLYSTLNLLNNSQINIITIEDPVEYQLAGLTQVQVNEKAGLTFSSILRNVLRQDPDIILVGEIRDEETAALAVRSALTGHLVFATLHTNSAVGAITRLLDMDIPSYLVASALRGVVAQRLIKRGQRRIGVFEVLKITPQIASKIKAETNELDIKELALSQGFISLDASLALR